MSEIRCVASPRAKVGEGPVWDDRRQVLWWVDVKNPHLFRYDPKTGENRAWPMPERLGCVALRENGGLIGAFRSGFKWIDPDTGAVEPIVDPEPDKPGNRFNDGKCDRRGRLFAGTMDNDEIACTGSLYRLDPDFSVHVMATDVYLSNGIDWSPDDRVMYYTDTLRHVIWAYDFDLETGEIDRRRPFAQVPEEAGGPDGLCVDAEGFVWSAHWGGWRVTRYFPDGRIERVIDLPASQITCPTFGGPDLDVLYASSAAIDMTEADFATAPDGGGLFALDAGARGRPVNRFAA